MYKKSSMRLFYLFISIFFFLTFGACAEEKSCDPGERECYTREGYPACRSRVDLDKYYEFLDTEKNSISKEIVSDSDRCMFLRGGEKVIVQYSDANKFKVYFRNLKKSFWVSNDALYGSSE